MAMRELLPSLWGREERSPSWRGEDRYPSTFNSFRRQLDRMFEDFTESLGLSERLQPGEIDLAPDMDVVESDRDVKITIELPGVDEDEIDVAVSSHTLTISGEKKSEVEDKSGPGARRERTYGAFMRSLTLPFQIDPDRVQAHYDRGVLTVTIPKPAEAVQETRKIEVSGPSQGGQGAIDQSSGDRSNGERAASRPDERQRSKGA